MATPTECNLDCMTARKNICNCPCDGRNHGRFLAIMGELAADMGPGEIPALTAESMEVFALELEKLEDHNVDASKLANHIAFIEKRYAGHVKASATNPCKCGCGKLVKRTFAQGHDARFHAAEKRVAKEAAATAPVEGATEEKPKRRRVKATKTSEI